MSFWEIMDTRATYRRPGFTVIRFDAGRPFCDGSDDDDPNPGGGEGFGDPNDI